MITIGQLNNAIQLLGKMGMDISAASSLGLASLPQDVAVTDDILSIVATFWPPVELIEIILPVALEILALAARNPAVNAIVNSDPLGRGGRRA